VPSLVGDMCPSAPFSFVERLMLQQADTVNCSNSCADIHVLGKDDDGGGDDDDDDDDKCQDITPTGPGPLPYKYFAIHQSQRRYH